MLNTGKEFLGRHTIEREEGIARHILETEFRDKQRMNEIFGHFKKFEGGVRELFKIFYKGDKAILKAIEDMTPAEILKNAETIKNSLSSSSSSSLDTALSDFSKDEELSKSMKALLMEIIEKPEEDEKKKMIIKKPTPYYPEWSPARPAPLKNKPHIIAENYKGVLSRIGSRNFKMNLNTRYDNLNPFNNYSGI